jgi:hypothetical protein
MPALPSQEAAFRRGPGIQPSAKALRAAVSVRGSRLPPEYALVMPWSSRTRPACATSRAFSSSGSSRRFETCSTVEPKPKWA